MFLSVILEDRYCNMLVEDQIWFCGKRKKEIALFYWAIHTIYTTLFLNNRSGIIELFYISFLGGRSGFNCYLAKFVLWFLESMKWTFGTWLIDKLMRPSVSFGIYHIVTFLLYYLFSLPCFCFVLNTDYNKEYVWILHPLLH